MPRRVENLVKSNVESGMKLTGVPRHGAFTVGEYRDHEVVLLLGQRGTRTTVSWSVLEDLPRFLVGRGWVPLGGAFDPATTAGTLETFLEGQGCDISPSVVATLLEAAGIVDVEGARPGRVRLMPSATALAVPDPEANLSQTSRRIQEGSFRAHPKIVKG